MQGGGGRGRGRRGGYPEPGRMGDGNGLALGFDAGTFDTCHLCDPLLQPAIPFASS